MVIFNSYVSLPEGMFSLPSYKWEKLLNTDLVTRVMKQLQAVGWSSKSWMNFNHLHLLCCPKNCGTKKDDKDMIKPDKAQIESDYVCLLTCQASWKIPELGAEKKKNALQVWLWWSSS